MLYSVVLIVNNKADKEVATDITTIEEAEAIEAEWQAKGFDTYIDGYCQGSWV